MHLDHLDANGLYKSTLETLFLVEVQKLRDQRIFLVIRFYVFTKLLKIITYVREGLKMEILASLNI